MKNENFPQFGIITSLSISDRTAKVYLPLFKIETGYIKIARNIPICDETDQYDINIESESLGNINGAADLSHKQGISVKSQVVVTFINGDTSNGVVTSWIEE